MNTTVNGPAKVMYKVHPLYEKFTVTDLPDCMYRMENIYGSGCMAVDDAEVKIKLDELENSQIKLLQKLEDMKSEVLAIKTEINAGEKLLEHGRILGERTDVRSQGKADDMPFGSLQLFEKPTKFQDIVISASPEHPPLSIWVFYHLLAKQIAARLATYIHSSLVTVPKVVTQLKGMYNQKCSDVSLTVIWKDVGKDPVMVVDPIAQGAIEGEVNIVRYIARLLNFEYEKDPIIATQMDGWLEVAHTSIGHGNNKERQSALRAMNSHLGKNSFFVGNTLSVVDIVLWSLILQARLHESLPANVSKWWKNLSSMDIFQFPVSVIS